MPKEADFFQFCFRGRLPRGDPAAQELLVPGSRGKTPLFSLEKQPPAAPVLPDLRDPLRTGNALALPERRKKRVRIRGRYRDQQSA